MTADSAMSYPSYVNPQVLTMFNVSTLLNQKDSRWLQLEVCREFQRQKCTRSDCECKFAHPPPNVEVQNGRVTACYDSIKVSRITPHLASLRIVAIDAGPRNPSNSGWPDLSIRKAAMVTVGQ